MINYNIMPQVVNVKCENTMVRQSAFNTKLENSTKLKKNNNKLRNNTKLKKINITLKKNTTFK